MSDTFKRVRDGEKLRIPARTYNAMIDAAQDYANRKNARADSDASGVLPVNMVYIKNSSGVNVDRLNILGISNSMIDVASNNFKQSTILEGIKPVFANHSSGRFVVTAEPIKDGAVGRACITGYFPIQIDVTNESHTYADVNDDIVTSLKSVETGSAVILWKEIGLGLKWALVRFGGSGGGGSSELKIILSKVPDEPNVDAGELTVEYPGNNTYEGRIYGKAYTQWNPTDDPYPNGALIYYNVDGLTYKVTASPAVTNMELNPKENTAEYMEFPEIIVEHVEQNENILLKETFPIFQVGDIVRVVSRTVDNQTKYYLAHTVSNRGETETANIMSITDTSGKNVVKVVY
ncbi:MAG: hypothetical protein A2Y12_04900 [Planctomycetes bacterium GWF2_42_9]|nr:MAG: hypothetical protein A2Y12_04900 [Planctomycetes bacterium GWF2_42_9]